MAAGLVGLFFSNAAATPSARSTSSKSVSRDSPFARVALPTSRPATTTRSWSWLAADIRGSAVAFPCFAARAAALRSCRFKARPRRLSRSHVAHEIALNQMVFHSSTLAPDRGPPLGDLRYTGNRMSPEDFAAKFAGIRQEMAKVVVGQEEVVEGVLVGLLAKGHVLIEGAPGLGKTLVARALGVVSGATFKRIQFTPDLMPSDVTGSSVFDRQTSAFTFIPGPIFTQVLLADEINRAPAKTQSSLLEAMQDRQVTVDGTSRPLPQPFVVIATQNPVESQGTYPLPEAQLDRFLMKLTANDPPRDVEMMIVKNHAAGFDPSDLSGLRAVTSPGEIAAMQAFAQGVQIDD